jgi:hypothetical protein
MWMPYSEERLVVAPTGDISGMDIWTIVVLLICFEIVELHCPDQIMRRFSYIQHIQVDIKTCNALHAITRRGKNNYYNWLGWQNTYAS